MRIWQIPHNPSWWHIYGTGKTRLKEGVRIEKDKDVETEMEPVRDGSELAVLVADVFAMTDREAEVVLGYEEGHGYALAGKDGRLYRGDICGQPENIIWEEYDIEEAINDAYEWNFAMMQDSERLMEVLESEEDHQIVSDAYKEFCADEKILDGLFDRTKYGKELEDMAVRIAGAIVSSLKEGKDIDSAVGQLKEGLAGMREDTMKKEERNKKGRAR